MTDNTNLAYARDLFHRMGGVVVNGAPLYNWKLFGKFSAWHCVGYVLFVRDFVAFSRRKVFDTSVKREVGYLENTSVLSGAIMVFAGFVTVMGWLWLRCSKPRVLIYTVDKVSSRSLRGDFRMEPIYRFLHQGRIPYIEVLHSLLGSSMLRNLVKRRRVGVYLESIDTLFVLLRKIKILPADQPLLVSDWGDIRVDEREFISFVIYKFSWMCALAEFRVRFFEKMFRKSSIRTLLMIDDVRYYNELTLAARRCGIKTYAFQHGHYTKYHLGWLHDSRSTEEVIRPHRLFVWSSYWKNELLRLGTYFKPEELKVASVSTAVERLASASRRSSSSPQQVITVIVPYEKDAPKKEVVHFIEGILKCTSCRVFFKTRPDRDLTEQLQEYGLEHFARNVEAFRAGSELNLEKLKTCIALGTYSTLLYQLIEFMVPVGYLETSSDFGEALVLNSLAEKVSPNEDLCLKLDAMTSLSPNVLETRRRILVDTNALGIESVLHHLTDWRQREKQ